MTTDSAERLADKITAEKEWKPSVAALRDAILRQFTERLDAIAERYPDRLDKAIAIVVQHGPGRIVLVISDPNAGDLVAELKRYASGESPIELLLQARMPI